MKNGNLSKLVHTLALLGPLLCGVNVAAQTYSLIDIGTAGGTYGEALGINSAGDVVGWSYTANPSGVATGFPNGANRAFVYSNGVRQDLGTVGGTSSTAFGINDAGQIAVGSADSQGKLRPAIYSQGSMQVPTPLQGLINGVALAINSTGDITGAGLGGGFVLTAGGTLRFLGSQAIGYGINDAGQVTGNTSVGSARAFLYEDEILRVFGTLGGEESVGAAINESGVVTGFSDNAEGVKRAFIGSCQGDMCSMQDLGAPAGGTRSAGVDINNHGQVVGNYIHGQHGQGFSKYSSGAFLYSNGLMMDLNTLIDPSSPLAPFVTLLNASGINDSGWIAATGIDARTGETHPYLLTVSAVPLPPAVFLIAPALAGLASLRRRSIAES